MKGQNKCQWLVIGSTELCRQSCVGEYCWGHLPDYGRAQVLGHVENVGRA